MPPLSQMVAAFGLVSVGQLNWYASVGSDNHHFAAMFPVASTSLTVVSIAPATLTILHVISNSSASTG